MKKLTNDDNLLQRYEELVAAVAYLRRQDAKLRAKAKDLKAHNADLLAVRSGKQPAVLRQAVPGRVRGRRAGGVESVIGSNSGRRAAPQPNAPSFARPLLSDYFL
jgi:hypothetical protein